MRNGMISQNLADLSENTLFQVRVRQAIMMAQREVRQVGLLMISFDLRENIGLDDGPLLTQFLEKSRLRLGSALRDSDAVYRITRGETAVLLPSLARSEDAVLVAKKILSKLEQPVLLEGLRIDVCPRIGIALFPEHSSNASALMRCAVVALNTARRTKQTYVLYSSDQSSCERPPLRFSELRRAIVLDQLFLHYQPKIDLKTGAVAGLEVLTRWHHPEHGLILPDEFIPIAERTGLIIPLTLWVLHGSLVQCRSWRDLGLDTSVAVNLSMWNLDALELPEQIDGLLKKIGIAPNRLELEITESAIMDDPQRAMRTLDSIRDLGVSFTIDDFGTGYSSLAHLKKLRVACIKIDKSFVENMENDKDAAVIVRSIIDLGHNLGLKVIAEGVETLEAKEMLTAFNCDEAQGYYFSYPVVPSEITRLLHRSTSLLQEGESTQQPGSNEGLAPLMGCGGTAPNSSLPSLLHCK
jgi:EAL domain-containing protein (putative c-di-GMP-specific phosphodiesterase class I)/GGDEF domain-containing protein